MVVRRRGGGTGSADREHDRQHLAAAEPGVVEVEPVEASRPAAPAPPAARARQARPGRPAERRDHLVHALQPVRRRDVVVPHDEARRRRERAVHGLRPDRVVHDQDVVGAGGERRQRPDDVVRRRPDAGRVDLRRVARRAQHRAHLHGLVRDGIVRRERRQQLVHRPHAASSSAVRSPAAVASQVSVAACAPPARDQVGAHGLILDDPRQRFGERVRVAGREPQRPVAGRLVERPVVRARHRHARRLCLRDRDPEALEQRRPAERPRARQHARHVVRLQVARDRDVVREPEPLHRAGRRAAVPAGRADQHQRQLRVPGAEPGVAPRPA